MSMNQLSVWVNHPHWSIQLIVKTLSETLKRKIVKPKEGYNLRSCTNNDLIVPPKTRVDCQGFSYHAVKFSNKLPIDIRNAKVCKSQTFVNMGVDSRGGQGGASPPLFLGLKTNNSDVIMTSSLNNAPHFWNPAQCPPLGWIWDNLPSKWFFPQSSYYHALQSAKSFG